MRTEAEVKRAIRIMEHVADSASREAKLGSMLIAVAVLNALKWTNGESGAEFNETLDAMAKIQSSKSN